MKFTVHDSTQALTECLSERIVELANRCIHRDRAFHFALAGGSTPAGLYRQLAAMRPGPDWSRVFIYFGDERHVPADSPQSNYRLASETLLQQVPIPAQNILAVDTGHDDPQQAARDYEQRLRRRLSRACNGIPSLDLILLGVGEDGHTASLFPGSPALRVTDRLVTSSRSEATGTERITFTLPLLNAARQVYIIATGEHKHAIVDEVRRLERDGIKKYPVQLVEGNGRVEWHLDRAAAGRDPSGF